MNAPAMLRPIGLILKNWNLAEIKLRVPTTEILAQPAAKLNMNPGDRNVPIINELTTDRSKVTVRAGLNPYWIKTMRETILANPNLRPGMGWGSNDSEI
jgi:putative SOS response-associated peptidase YedK